MGAPSSSSGPHIVVLGLGFGGLHVVKELSELFPYLPEGVRVTGIDSEERHTFTPLLYEVASSAFFEREAVSEEAVVDGASILYKTLFDRYPDEVQFLQDRVCGIDVEQKVIEVEGVGSISYDVLVYALGSRPEWYGVPGASEYSMPMKTIRDAMKIHGRVHELIDRCCSKNEPARFVVVGGGPMGVEFSGEIQNLVNQFEARKEMRKGAFEVHLLHAGKGLLERLHASHQQRAIDRLQGAGVHVHVQKKVTEVVSSEVRVEDGTTHPFDVLVWAGGVRGGALAEQLQGASLTDAGLIEVDQQLRVTGCEDVFAIGDAVSFALPEGGRVPGLAQVAMKQGALVARSIVSSFLGRPLRTYRPAKEWVHVVPISGRYGLVEFRGFRLAGPFGYWLRLAADVLYFLRLLPVIQALRHWGRGARSYRKNDVV